MQAIYDGFHAVSLRMDNVSHLDTSMKSIDQPEELTLRKVIGMACMFVVLATVGGCGSSADGLVKEQIKAMNELADALEAKAAPDKIKNLETKMDELGKKMEALKLSEADMKSLLEANKDEMTKAMGRMFKAAMPDMGKMMEGMGKMPDMGKMPEMKMPDLTK